MGNKRLDGDGSLRNVDPGEVGGRKPDIAIGGFQITIFDFRDYAVQLAVAGMPRASLRGYECAARQFLVLEGLLKAPVDFADMALRTVRAQIITAAKQNAPSKAAVFLLDDLAELPPRFRALAICLFILGMRKASVLSIRGGDVVVDRRSGAIKFTARHFKVLDERSSGTAFRPCNCGPNGAWADNEFCLAHGPLAGLVEDLFPVEEEEVDLLCAWLGGTSHTFRRSLAVAMRVWFYDKRTGDKRASQIARRVFMWTKSSMMFPYYSCDWRSHMGKELLPVHWLKRFVDMGWVGTVAEEDEADLRDDCDRDDARDDKVLVGSDDEGDD